MNDLIRHRGPDDEGYALFPDLSGPPVRAGGSDTPPESWKGETPYMPQRNISECASDKIILALGHRRLSIVDLSPLGHQPLSYDDGRYWLTYNGEVYNYIELRAELESLGHKFLSHSDTEVIIAAYRQWGTNCLPRFNGMWGFAIYDRVTRKLFIARDRFGVKPLYYWVSPDGLVCFGSEIKQFTSMPGWRAVMNGRRAYDFLAWGLTDHTDETLFAGVYQLPPGHFMEFTLPQVGARHGARLPVTRWYTLKPAPFSGSFDDAAAKFRELLRASVVLRLRADVPVGSCLSGGLDSSSIVCLMNDLLREKGANELQKTFSACARIEKFNEKNWIDEVVSRTKVDAHYVYPDLKSLFDESETITWHQDEPFGSTSIYAQWNVFRLAAQNDVIVMLDGQGADEQLAGYHGFFGARLADLLRGGKFVKFWREMSAMQRVHGYSRFYLLEQTANMLLPLWLKSPLKKLVGRNTAAPDWMNLDLLRARPSDPHNMSGNGVYDLSYSQMTATNINMLLHWEDRDSMAHAIESRVPFLDYRLVEFNMGLPDEYKLDSGMTKRVLRAGMSGVIPDKIRDRVDKLGFVTPEETWIREHGSDLFRAKIDEAIASSRGIITPAAKAYLEDIIAGKRRFSFIIWRMISFGQWMKLFDVRLPEGAKS